MIREHVKNQEKRDRVEGSAPGSRLRVRSSQPLGTRSVVAELTRGNRNRGSFSSSNLVWRSETGTMVVALSHHLHSMESALRYPIRTIAYPVSCPRLDRCPWSMPGRSPPRGEAPNWPARVRWSPRLRVPAPTIAPPTIRRRNRAVPFCGLIVVTPFVN